MLLSKIKTLKKILRKMKNQKVNKKMMKLRTDISIYEFFRMNYCQINLMYFKFQKLKK